MLQSWKDDVGQEPCCGSQFFVHLLVPLDGNGNSQAHNFSYWGYIFPTSLIFKSNSGGLCRNWSTSPTGHSWQQVFELEESYISKWFPKRKRKNISSILFSCCHFLYISPGHIHSSFLKSYELRISTRSQRNSCTKIILSVLIIV